MNKIRVGDVMTHLVATLRPEDTIENAGRMLVRNRISGAPVVQRGKLVGLVSEADLVRALVPPHGGFPYDAIDLSRFQLRGARSRSVEGACVRDVMSQNVVSISMAASVWEAASLLDRYGFRRLPVIDGDGYVIGVLARSDLVRAMARTDPDLVTSVWDAIGVLGLENFSNLDVVSENGCVAIRGTVDRRSMGDLATKIAARVPGVLEVSDQLEWRWDDTEVTPVCNRAALDDLASDLCSATPLVEVAPE